MSLFKRIKKYIAPSKKTLERGVESVGQNLESAGRQIGESFTNPSGEIGKKLLATVGGALGASLGDPYAGKAIKNALHGRPVTQGVGGPVGLASRAIAAQRADNNPYLPDVNQEPLLRMRRGFGFGADAQATPAIAGRRFGFGSGVAAAPPQKRGAFGSRSFAAQTMLEDQV